MSNSDSNVIRMDAKRFDSGYMLVAEKHDYTPASGQPIIDPTTAKVLVSETMSTDHRFYPATGEMQPDHRALASDPRKVFGNQPARPAAVYKINGKYIAVDEEIKRLFMHVTVKQRNRIHQLNVKLITKDMEDESFKANICKAAKVAWHKMVAFLRWRT